MFEVHISGWGWLVPVSVILATRLLGWLPWHGIHWGGSRSDRPGLWLFRRVGPPQLQWRKVGGANG